MKSILFLISLWSFLLSSSAVSAAESVVVDFGQEQNPVTYRASGFIGSISETVPPDSLLLPLKPKLLSWDRSYNGIQRALANGIQYQIKLHNLGTIPTTADGDWSKWEKLVRDRATEAKNNQYTNVEFDIWNEPEFSDYWSGPIDERYYQMWIRAYRQIKLVDPNFLVAGPSSTNYSWTMNTFLPRAKTENTLPDILTWHELWSDGAGISQRVANMRTYLQNNGINISKISINEYDSSTSARKPGILVRFFYEFEKAAVYSAAKACWQEGGDWNCQIHLDNTLTYPDQQKRSAWWTYKVYADMTGVLVSGTPSANFVVLAAKDSALSKGYLLVGNFAASSAVDIVLNNLDQTPFYTAGQAVRCIVSRIPNTETAALSAPVVIADSLLSPQNNQLVLPLTGIGLYDAYFITLESASPGASPTPTPVPTGSPLTGDINGDSKVNFADLRLVLAGWGAVGVGNEDKDLNDDGQINSLDMAVVIRYWFP